MSLLKLLIAVTPLVSLANCSGDSCVASEDATSLIQTQQQVKSHRQPTQTQTQVITQTVTQTINEDESFNSNMYNPVEMNQSYYKAAYANNSIAQYALAAAKRNRLQAKYNEMKANYKSEGKDFASTDAGRSLTRSLVYADQAMNAWKLASEAYNQSNNAFNTYQRDYEGKANALKNISQNEFDATEAYHNAQRNFSDTKIQAQNNVDRAAAQYSAHLAYVAKVKAAAAVAAYKNATQLAKKAQDASDVAKKASDKQKKAAINSGWQAHKDAVKTLKAEQKAEAAAVDQEAADSVQWTPDAFSWEDNIA